MEFHVVQVLNGMAGEIEPSDIWLSIDQFINGTVDMGPGDNGTNSTNITGGTCNNVQVSTWSATHEGETFSGSHELCMDDCESAGGSVTIVTDAQMDYSSSYPECQISEELCGADWWQSMGPNSWCDIGCKLSGGKLEDVEWGKMCQHEAGACAYPYEASWSDEEVCDFFCQTNSGVLDPNTGMCHYENMT